jgi:hypothetical protein
VTGRCDPRADRRNSRRQHQCDRNQDADQHDLSQSRPDALVHRLAGPVVFRQGHRQDQIGEQPGAAEQGDDHERDSDQGRVEAEVVREAAGDAPEHPVVSRAQQRAAGADLRFVLLCLLVFLWLICHGDDDDAAALPRLSGMVPNEPPMDPKTCRYARDMEPRRLVPSHFNKDGKPKRGYVREEVAKAEAARFGMTYYRCDVCDRFHLASKS